MTKEIKRHLILGCDPGFSGALAIYDSKNLKLIEVKDMPVKKTIKNQSGDEKTDICIFSLSSFIDSFSQDLLFCVVEEVGVMTGKEGRQGMFRFGEGFGILKGILGAFNIPTVQVKPAIWKSLENLSHNKSDSLDKARRLFPEMAHAFRRKMDNGRAEAAILARFGMRFKK